MDMAKFCDGAHERGRKSQGWNCLLVTTPIIRDLIQFRPLSQKKYLWDNSHLRRTSNRLRIDDWTRHSLLSLARKASCNVESVYEQSTMALLRYAVRGLKQ